MKSILVIGIGRFGKHLAQKLTELGNEVMIVDQNESNVEKLLPYVTAAQIGDCTDEMVLRSLGVANFDLCFVCIGSNFQSSLEVTSLLKENGAKFVIAKADRDIHAKFLLRNGADEVTYPERDVAVRTAMKYSANNVFDYIELTPQCSIYEITPLHNWVGRSIKEVDVRSHYNITIIGRKEEGMVYPMADGDYIFKKGEHLIVSGSQADAEKLFGKK